VTTLPPPCAVVMKSENLNFLKPSGPLQACNGTALPIYYHHNGIIELRLPSDPPLVRSKATHNTRSSMYTTHSVITICTHLSTLCKFNVMQSTQFHLRAVFHVTQLGWQLTHLVSAGSKRGELWCSKSQTAHWQEHVHSRLQYQSHLYQNVSSTDSGVPGGFKPPPEIPKISVQSSIA